MRLIFTIAALLLLVLVSSAHAVSFGQIDDFQSGSVSNWQIGVAGPSPIVPVVISTGGPGGAGDQFLQLTSIGGSGAGSRLAVFNINQWTGNYTTAGITSISMDVQNLGATTLNLRLLFSNSVSSAQAVSTNPVVLLSGSGWMHVSFPIQTTDLTALFGTAAGALSGTTELRLIHNTAASFPPPPIAAVLGVDNIQAPEPGTMLLVCSALGLLIPRRRR